MLMNRFLVFVAAILAAVTFWVSAEPAPETVPLEIVTVIEDTKPVDRTDPGLIPVELVHITTAETTPTEPIIESRYADIALSESDVELLARIIWLEARGECFDGQQAVAEVVFNRMLSGSFPDTLTEVIYQKGQFSTAANVDKATPGEMQYLAIHTALTGANVLPLEVVFFATSPENDNVWGTIGGHTFCYPYYWEGE